MKQQPTEIEFEIDEFSQIIIPRGNPQSNQVVLEVLADVLEDTTVLKNFFSISSQVTDLYRKTTLCG